MAYSAYCDTASATKWWITGTGSSVNRLSEVMDDNASGVEEYDNPGNYQPWSTFMTETVEDGVYLIHLPLEVGNGSTATTLTSLDEMVYFDDGVTLQIENYATLELGENTYGDWSSKGAFWNLGTTQSVGYRIIPSGGTGIVRLYGSRLHNRAAGYMAFSGGTLSAKNSIFSCEFPYNDTNSFRRFYIGATTIEFEDVLFLNNYSVDILNTPTTFEDVHIHKAQEAISTTKDVVVTNVKATEVVRTVRQQGSTGQTIQFVDMYGSVVLPAISNSESNVIQQRYTCNITVADKDGTLLDDVVVDCEDDDGTAVWTAGTEVTGATNTGKIDEQTITCRSWTGTSGTLKTYSPHKFTLSKAGYETLILENITVDAPIV